MGVFTLYDLLSRCCDDSEHHKFLLTDKDFPILKCSNSSQNGTLKMSSEIFSTEPATALVCGSSSWTS